ncbi:MAG TPA: hypothetical protein VFJ14_12000, partial [Nocardioidaceae bacterium]|nr:hypothetical protein [Nocardioidaceae bacterium]
ADATLANPVLTAAGCAGVGRELAQFFDVGELGAVVTRSVTRDARPGGSGARMAETAAGMLSDLDLGGAGIDTFLATDLPWLAQRRTRAVVSIAGSTLEEYAELARRVGTSPGVTAVEVNLLDLAGDAQQAARVASVVRRDTARGIPVLVKLAPDVTSIVDVARSVVDSGADGLVLGGRLRAMSIDHTTMRPALGGVAGGLSGPAVRPVALRCVWEVHVAMPEVPLVGSGGVRCGLDALEFMLAGASAVQVGTFTFRDPCAPLRVRDELATALAERGFSRAGDAIGHAHRAPRQGGRR